MIRKRGALKAPLFISPMSGFSLVELMIVVAIIGFLSAIAIPNFQKFQAKSKTTEAKLQLSAIYTAEASFYSTYQMYHSCLRYMGYDPTEFKSSRFYAVGFSNNVTINPIAYSSAVTLDLSNTECPDTLAPTADLTYFDAGTGIGNAIATSSHIPASTVGDQSSALQMTFIAGAGGVISKSFSATSNSSAFTIDQTKKFQTIRTGY